MASRPLIKPYLAITAGDLTTTLVSKVTVIDQLSLISYHCTWVGSSPVANVTIEVSDNYSQNADGSVANAGTWVTLPLSISPQITGNSGDGFIDIQQFSGNALRLRSTPVSGTGTLNVLVSAKVQ